MRKQISPVLVDNLIRLAVAYHKATDNKGSMRSISRNAHGDPPFFDKLMAGQCSVTLRKYDEVVAWFDDEADWPPGYVRPKLNDPKHGRRVPQTATAPAPGTTTKPKKAKTDGEGQDGSKRGRKKAVPVGDCG